MIIKNNHTKCRMEENIIFQEKNGIRFIQFKKLLELGITHAYTLKGNEINFTCGDKYEDESWNKICSALNIDKKQILASKQAHTDCIKCVNEMTDLDELKFVDGMITDKPGIALATRNADCILFSFYDPVKRVIANVHSRLERNFQKNIRKNCCKNDKQLWL